MVINETERLSGMTRDDFGRKYSPKDCPQRAFRGGFIYLGISTFTGFNGQEYMEYICSGNERALKICKRCTFYD